jgi:hypothetical protein
MTNPMRLILGSVFDHLDNPVVEHELQSALLTTLSDQLRKSLRERVPEVICGRSTGITSDAIFEEVHKAIVGALTMRLQGEPDFAQFPFILSRLGKFYTERWATDWPGWAEGEFPPSILN